MTEEESKTGPGEVHWKSSMDDNKDPRPSSSSSSTTTSPSCSSEEENMGEQERQDPDWVRHYRGPYVTDELIDRLTPYAKKMVTTPGFKEYVKYMRTVNVEKPLTYKEKMSIAQKWEERENPRAFWKKWHQEQEEKEKENENCKAGQCRKKGN